MNDLRKLKIGRVLFNVDLKDYTTYKLKGKAYAIVFPNNINQLIKILKYLRNNSLKHKVLGKGSNIIFKGDYDGVLIKLDKLNNLIIDDTKIVVGAGYSLANLAVKTCNLGLIGLDFATGIPGTVGGAVYMNAGAYNSDMGYVVSEVKVLTPDYKIKTMYNKELEFHYRNSFLQKNKDYICLEVTIILKNGEKQEIISNMEERKKRRLMTQPLEYPSAGSVFRNPENDFAGRLIEDIGYKGKRIGGAEVSEKHANFIINKDGASGEDIVKLIAEIKKEVLKKHNIELKVEQEIVE